ncbi:MAG: hypothetical protein Q7R93_04035 [bacterium]|nr:hypothetical protein [bacterium]
MKRLFKHNLVGFLIGITALAAVPEVGRAQVATPPEQPRFQPASYDGYEYDQEGDIGQGASYDLPEPTPAQREAITAANKAIADDAAANTRSEANKTQSPDGQSASACGFLASTFSPVFCTLSWVANAMMWISARVLWIAGIILNKSIALTINMSSILDSLPIVDIGWKVLRDISNIVFIFIALWCGISITLGLGDNGSKGWGLLAHVVLVALFINFSLFITKAVIDASNIAALHFYSLIQQPDHKSDWDGGISEAFMNGLQIQSLYNSSNIKTFDSKGGNTYVDAAANSAGTGSLSYTNILLVGVLGSVTILVAAFVFFAAAIMFIIRLVTLIMLMILSPLAFVAWILPGASGLASSWWSKLWTQSFFAPLYLALAYVVVSAINAPGFNIIGGKTGEGIPSFAAAFVGFEGSSISIIFNFIVIIGLLVGCLIVAQQLGAKGSDLMVSWGHKLAGEGTGFVGRHAMQGFGVGRLGEKWQEHNAAKKGRVGLFSKVGAAALKYTSVRNINERLGQTEFYNKGVGKFFREQTTGRLADAKFGGSTSAEESYEEREHNESTVRAVQHITTARKAGAKLAPLRRNQNVRDNALEATQAGVAAAEREISQGRAKTPEQQADIATAQADLAAAQAPTAAITAAQQALTLAQGPDAHVTQAQADLAAAQAAAQAPTAQITAALTALTAAQAPTPALIAAKKALADAQALLATNPTSQGLKDSAIVAEQRLDQANSIHQRSIAPFEQALAQLQVTQQAAHEPQIEAAQRALLRMQAGQQTGITIAEQKLTQAKEAQATEVAAKEKILVDAQGPTQDQQNSLKGWAAYQEAEKKHADNKDPANEDALKEDARIAREALTPEYTKLAEAQDELAKAEKELKDFTGREQGNIDNLVNTMSKAFTKLTSKEYVDLTPKDDHFKPELVDYGILPASFVRALVEDEHALTEGEKEEMIHARLHRAEEEAGRGEKRNERYHDRHIEYRVALNISNQVKKTLPDHITFKQQEGDLEVLKKKLAKLEKQIEKGKGGKGKG